MAADFELDTLDRRLLDALQRDASLSAAELASACHASAATVYRRLNRLKAMGAIRRQVSILDERVAPRPVKVVVEVTLERQSQASQHAFQAAMRANGAVTTCRMVAGETDYLIEAHFAQKHDLNAFLDNELAARNGVRKYRTLFVMKDIKFEPAVSL